MSSFKIKSNNKIIFISAAVIIAALIFGYFAFFSNNNDKSPSYPEVVKNSTDDPDESPLDNYVWKGKDSDPKYIDLPSIKAGGYIQKVAIDQRKEVGVPSNVNLAGYFTESSLPGSKGLSIIDGHVDGKSKPGIFKNLGKLKKGATFEVEFGSGKKQKFKVTDTRKVNKDKAPPVLFSQDPSVTSQLNLITCGGTYDKKARRYLDRIIIYSVPI